MSDIYPGQKRMILPSNGKLKTSRSHILIRKIHNDIVFYCYPEEAGREEYTRDMEHILKHTIPDHVYLAQKQFDKDLEELLEE